MLATEAPAHPVAQAVGGHHVGADLAFVGWLQVAELAAHIGPPLGHERGAQGGIAVGGDVPVVRLHVGHAIAAVEPDGGWQQAGLALFRQREGDVRNGQHRDALELQHRVFGRAHLFLVVDADGGGAQHPVGLPAFFVATFAGGVGAVVHHGAVAVHKVHPRRVSMRLRGQEAVARVAEEALEGLHPQLQRRAFVDVAGAVDAHLAVGFGQVLGHVVVQPVGADDRVAPAQLGVAFDQCIQIGLAADVIALHKHGQLRAHGVGNLFLQQRGGPQRRRRIPGAGRGGVLGQGRQRQATPGQRNAQGQHAGHGGPQPCRLRRGGPGAKGGEVLHGGWLAAWHVGCWGGSGQRDRPCPARTAPATTGL